MSGAALLHPAEPRHPSSGFAGLLAVDKPAGVTSHDVVAIARRRLHQKSAGHLGTLDPGASGLLLLALGAATRCVPVWQGGEKTYEATVRFGVSTTTQDMQGEVLAERSIAGLDEPRVREAARQLVGEIDQIPPMISALKHQGVRLYKLARRGETVERAPRRVRVSSWEWLEFALPLARFQVRCSGGTYVRTLAHDLGEALGVGGAIAALRRLRSEPFGLERAITLRELETLPPDESLVRAGCSLEQALAHLPAISLAAAEARVIGYGGRPLVTPPTAIPLSAGPRSVLVRGPLGELLALAELEPDALAGVARVCPHVVFPWAVREG